MKKPRSEYGTVTWLTPNGKPPGSCRIRVPGPKGPDGKRRRLDRTFRDVASRTEANSLLRSLAREVGTFIAADMTLREFVEHDWLDEMELRIEAGEIRVSTLDEYLGKLNCHVLGTSEDVQRRAKKPVGYLGDVRLRDLDDTRLRRHQRELAASGVSAANRKHVFRVLHSVLQVAIELRLLDRHPMDAMSAPDAKTPEFVLPEDDQALRILGLYEGTAIEAPVLLAANGAFRLSEICGLDWQDHFEFTTWADPEDPDVTYDVALVSIERGYHDTSAGRRFEDPKSDTSERVVPIIGPAATRLKELRGIGPVCVLDGERMTSMQLYNAYRVIWQRAHRKDPSLPWVPPRNLRHLVGVQMVEGGVNVTLVSLFFGHSTDVITRQHYVRRVREKMLRGAALTLAKSRQAR